MTTNYELQPVFASSESVSLTSGYGASFTFTSAALSGTLGVQVHVYNGHPKDRMPLEVFISDSTYAATNTFKGTVSGTPALGTILGTHSTSHIAALSTTGGAFSVVLQGTGGEAVAMGVKLGEQYFTSTKYTVPTS